MCARMYVYMCVCVCAFYARMIVLCVYVYACDKYEMCQCGGIFYKPSVCVCVLVCMCAFYICTIVLCVCVYM